MQKESYLKEFIRYGILGVLGMLGVSCYILADTYFVSKGLGTKGLAALNIAIPVYNFIHGTGLMLGMGGATRFAICKGQKDTERINTIFTNTIYVAILAALIFTGIGALGAKSLAELLGADRQILSMTTIYLKWLLLFAPAFILNDVLLCFVRNDEGPQLAMTAMLLGSFSNIILDYIFIFEMNMGIFGAVFATGLSPMISILIMLPHWLRRKNHFRFIRIKPHLDVIRQNLSVGFPALITEMSSGIVMITFNGLILELEGNIGVAAYGVIANISLVVMAVYTGIAQGIQPLFSRFYGQGEQKTVSRVLGYAIKTIIGLSAAIYLTIFVLAEPISKAFNSEQNMQLQSIAVYGLKVYFTAVLFAGFNIVIAIFFTSTEKVVPAHVLSLLRGLILIVPMAVLLSALFGMTGIWLALPVTELIVAIAGVVKLKICQN